MSETTSSSLQIVDGANTSEQPSQNAPETRPESRNSNQGVQIIPEGGGGPQSQAIPHSRKRKQKCRFFATKKGCRAGDSCPFVHDRASADAEPPFHSTASNITGTHNEQQRGADEKPLETTARPSQAPTPKPPTEPQDPRSFQVNQIVRRFRARQETLDNGTLALRFSMPPSDPDFPFDIEALECTLKVPPEFPKPRLPTLRVTNKEMERGYQVNVERGFDAIWSQAANPTLLNAMKVLDKRLEVLLTAQKAEIVKLVANAGIPGGSAPNKVETKSSAPLISETATKSRDPPPPPAKPARPVITAERRAQAKTKRDAEVEILEHRLGRNPLFQKTADGTIFTVPIEPRKRTALPPPLQAVKAVHLLVPAEYDVEPCGVELLGVEGEAADNVSQSFVKRVTENPEASLLAHVNYLAQNMHLMAATPPKASIESTSSAAKDAEASNPEPAEEKLEEETTKNPLIKDTDREHVKIIQRPPEWDAGPDEDEDDTTDGYDTEYETSEGDEEDEDAEEAKEATPAPTSAPREQGILVSFPELELHNIELLELILINLTVKCERCKDTMDVSKIKPQSEETNTTASGPTEIHSTSCKKCANPFSIGYRKDIMHAHSSRAGYLDLEGCTVVDLLPSTFVPTCADCSTPATANGGIVSVRGESPLAICRACHRKMNFRIPEVKFLHIGPAMHRLPLRAARRPKKETLGIVAGTELPNRGKCTHYSKSYRWFRFGCCGAVFACDRCHDKATDHPNEFASRMICGWCSREQPYRPEDCIHCRKGVTGRTGSGFWEGGKGTRERARMSRKDPRKYKRRGGGAIAAKHK